MEAVEKFKENRKYIQLVIFKPKMSGKDAFEIIRKTAPDIRAIFISGYTADIIRSKKIIEEDMPFVSKPVYPDKLLTKIREVLES